MKRVATQLLTFNHGKKISVAVIQSAPVLFDLQGTLSKVAELMQKARGAELMLFPEAFVSVYPRGLSFGTVVGVGVVQADNSGSAIGMHPLQKEMKPFFGLVSWPRSTKPY